MGTIAHHHDSLKQGTAGRVTLPPPSELVETVVVVGLHQAGDYLGVVLDDAPDGAKLLKKSAQLLLGVKANVHNDVVEASDDGEKLHLLKLGQFLGDSVNPTAVHGQVDDGSLGRSHPVGVNPGLNLQQVAVEQALDPIAGGGFGDVDAIADLFVGDPSVFLEQLNDATVQVVQVGAVQVVFHKRDQGVFPL